MEGFDFSLAPHGVVIVNDTTEKTGLHSKAIYIAEDSVISSIKYEGDNANIADDIITTKANAVKQFVVITPANGKIFDAITLTSGSVVGIKAK